MAEQRKAEQESHVKWRIAEAQRKHLERQKKTGHFPSKVGSGTSSSSSGSATDSQADVSGGGPGAAGAAAAARAGATASARATSTAADKAKAVPQPKTLGTRQMSLKLAFALCKEIKSNAQKNARTLGKMPEGRAVGAGARKESSESGPGKFTPLSGTAAKSDAGPTTAVTTSSAIAVGGTRFKAASMGLDMSSAVSHGDKGGGVSSKKKMAERRKVQSEKRRHTVGQGRAAALRGRRKLTMEHLSPRRLQPLQVGRPTSAEETTRERRASLTSFTMGVEGVLPSSSTATTAASLMLDLEQQHTGGVTVGCGRRASLARRGKERSGALRSLKRGKRNTISSPKDLQEKVAVGEIGIIGVKGLMVTGGKKL